MPEKKAENTKDKMMMMTEVSKFIVGYRVFAVQIYDDNSF
tara:strand:+ start:905 stop:1024 length:120 start_codon:yes stop_codon:yes gene_type:complete